MGRRELEGPPSRLRAARREAQVSLTDFARRVGYSRSYLSAVELGHLPETESIVLAYESGLGLGRGSLLEGKQSVARVLDRVSALSVNGHSTATEGRVELVPGRLTVLSRAQAIAGIATFVSDVIDAESTAGEAFRTSFSEADDTLGAEHQAMAAALHRMVDRGWQVNHLVRLSSDVGRSLQLMESVLGLLAAGSQYRVLFAAAGAALPAAMDCLVVVGHGAVIRFDTEDSSRQAVMLITEKAGVEALVEHCLVLQATTSPLIEAIDAADLSDFERLLVRNESEVGDRVLVRGAIALTHLRADVPEPNTTPGIEASTDVSHAEDYYLPSRMERFLKTLERHKVRHVYLKEPIEELVGYSRALGEGLVPQDSDQRYLPHHVRSRIQSLLSLLRDHPGFEIALLDREEASLIQATQGDSVVYWQAQGNELLLESWPRVGGGDATHLHIAVHEEAIAAAFMEHFKNVWARVSPLNRDKAYVIWWFEQQLQALEF